MKDPDSVKLVLNATMPAFLHSSYGDMFSVIIGS